jgi:hypothetical protein
MSITAFAFPSQIQAASCIRHKLAVTPTHNLCIRAVKAFDTQIVAVSRQSAGIQALAAAGTFMELK